MPAVRRRTRSGNRKGSRRGPAGQPRAQALGTAAGPDVRPEWAVQASSAFPGWHPERPCHQGSRAGLFCSTLSGSERGRFPGCQDPCFFPGLAPWAVLLDPFRVGAWVIPRVPGCVFLPRACALGCPARPFQGRTVGDSPGARMRVSSQGLRPGLSCATLSGSSAYTKRASARHAGKIYNDRHGSRAAADCQTSAHHQAFTGNNHAAHSHSLTCGQQPVLCGAGQIHSFQPWSITPQVGRQSPRGG